MDQLALTIILTYLSNELDKYYSEATQAMGHNDRATYMLYIAQASVILNAKEYIQEVCQNVG